MAIELIHMIRGIYLVIVGILLVSKPKSAIKFGIWFGKVITFNKLKQSKNQSTEPIKFLGYLAIISGIISGIYSFY
ncbi:hypothetical protein ACFLZZ_00375 [Nanoarchaeota archaeon]